MAVLSSVGLLSPFLLSFISSGEASGMLPDLLKKASDLLQKDFEDRMKMLAILLPVAAYLIMAVYSGYIIVKQVGGLYGPLFDILK